MGADKAQPEQNRTVPQTARLLVEEGLQLPAIAASTDGLLSTEIAALAVAGSSFDWLNEEPDLYGDTCGEPL